MAVSRASYVAVTASRARVAQLALGVRAARGCNGGVSKPEDAFASDLELLCTDQHQPLCSQGGRRALQSPRTSLLLPHRIVF